MALFAVLGSLAVGCQKETTNSLSPVTTSIDAASYTVTYYVDGVRHHVQTCNDNELLVLLNQLAALAREGHRVAIYKGDTANVSSTKEKITFQTTNKEEAIAWSDAMLHEGYSVIMYFDEESGEYTCIATK